MAVAGALPLSFSATHPAFTLLHPPGLPAMGCEPVLSCALPNVLLAAWAGACREGMALLRTGDAGWGPGLG